MQKYEKTLLLRKLIWSVVAIFLKKNDVRKMKSRAGLLSKKRRNGSSCRSVGYIGGCH
jgi:hypothetical protein